MKNFNLLLKATLPPTAGVIGALGVLVYVAAVAMQATLNLTPCPLCILQRYCLIGLTLLCFGAAAARGRGQQGLLAGAVLAALAGLAFAARQVYLQASPSMSLGCGPGFDYIVNAFPLSEMLPMLFRGTGDCAQIDWAWHGVTLPKMSLATFVGFAGLLGPRLMRTR
jgi:disulfide bond formation protein DsbB